MILNAPKNLYLVHGWRVEGEIQGWMMDKGADARDLGLSVTLSADGKNAFVGRHLGTVDIRDGKEFAGISIPTRDEQKSLEEIWAKIGFGVAGPPILYVIAG